MASNSPTLMQSEERLLNELTSDDSLKEQDYTICFCLSKAISTTDIDDIVKQYRSKFSQEGWDIDDIDVEKDF